MKWEGAAGPPPLLVKIAPDLTQADMEGALCLLRLPDGLWGSCLLHRLLVRCARPDPGRLGGCALIALWFLLFGAVCSYLEAKRGRPGFTSVSCAPRLLPAPADIAAVALAQCVDGLVVSNTTITRPAGIAHTPVGKEAGGLSGKPLFQMATEVGGLAGFVGGEGIAKEGCCLGPVRLPSALRLMTHRPQGSRHPIPLLPLTHCTSHHPNPLLFPVHVRSPPRSCVRCTP